MHLLIGKQVLCEPLLEDDEEPPIDWDAVDAAIEGTASGDAFPGADPPDGATAATLAATAATLAATDATATATTSLPPLHGAAQASARLFAETASSRTARAETASSRAARLARELSCGTDGGDGGATTARLARGELGASRSSPALVGSARESLFTPGRR